MKLLKKLTSYFLNKYKNQIIEVLKNYQIFLYEFEKYKDRKFYYIFNNKIYESKYYLYFLKNDILTLKFKYEKFNIIFHIEIDLKKYTPFENSLEKNKIFLLETDAKNYLNELKIKEIKKILAK